MDVAAATSVYAPAAALATAALTSSGAAALVSALWNGHSPSRPQTTPEAHSKPSAAAGGAAHGSAVGLTAPGGSQDRDLAARPGSAAPGGRPTPWLPPPHLPPASAAGAGAGAPLSPRTLPTVALGVPTAWQGPASPRHPASAHPGQAALLASRGEQPSPGTAGPPLRQDSWRRALPQGAEADAAIRPTAPPASSGPAATDPDRQPPAGAPPLSPHHPAPGSMQPMSPYAHAATADALAAAAAGLAAAVAELRGLHSRPPTSPGLPPVPRLPLPAPPDPYTPPTSTPPPAAAPQSPAWAPPHGGTVAAARRLLPGGSPLGACTLAVLQQRPHSYYVSASATGPPLDDWEPGEAPGSPRRWGGPAAGGRGAEAAGGGAAGRPGTSRMGLSQAAGGSRGVAAREGGCLRGGLRC
jgi:hypothetical protein